MASRAHRMTKNQKQKLIDYLENHKYLIEGRARNVVDLERYRAKWEELAEILNKEDGAKKTVSQWKESINDFKANVRKKARALHLETTGTGGGPKNKKDLTDIEERLLSLLSPVVIAGVPELPEASISQNVELVQIVEDTDIHNFENVAEVSNEKIEVLMIAPINAGGAGGNENDENRSTNVTGESLTKKRKRKNKENVGQTEFSSVAIRHEKCLKELKDSNNYLAQSVAKLALCLKKKKLTNSVFSL